MFANELGQVALVLPIFFGVNLPEAIIGLQEKKNKPGEVENNRLTHQGSKETGPQPHRSPKPAQGEPSRLALIRADRVSFLAFSPGSNTLAYNLPSEKAMVLCKAATGKQVCRLWEKRIPKAAVFCPDGKKLIVANFDSELCLWDLATRSKLYSFHDSHWEGEPFALSPDGKFLVATRYTVTRTDHPEPDDNLYVWETATGKQIRSFGAGPFGGVRAFALACDGKTLIAEHHLLTGVTGVSKASVSSFKITLHLWSVPGGKHLAQIGEPAEWTGKGSPFPAGQKLREMGAQDKGFWTLLLRDNKHLVLPCYPRNGFLTVSQSADTFWLLEAATGKQLHRFSDFKGTSHVAVALSPDGNALAGGGPVSAVLIWDVSSLNRASRQRAAERTTEDLAALWTDLAEKDIARANRAMCALAHSPEPAVRLLQLRLKPVPKIDGLPRLVSQLDSAVFKTRQKAARDLEALGEAARPALEKALRDRPSPEMRRLVQELLAKLQTRPLQPEEVRGLRAIDVLEHIGTEEARQLLKQLAQGAPAAFLTEAAEASLERLAPRRSTKP
jgi:WD40 repeat protein